MANGVTFPSDITLKDSIAPVTNALATLAQLQPKTYVFKTDSFPYMNLPEGRQIGLISQQLDTIPELENLVQDILQPEILDTDGMVLMDTMTFKGLNYTSLIPLAISGINELSAGKVNADENPTDSSYVVKWSATNKTLTNSAIYNTGGKVGINTAAPASILHVNSASTGEVFRTNAPSGTATYWRMLRNGTEYGSLYNNNNNIFYIQAGTASGELRFNTAGGPTRMTITSSGSVGIRTLSPSSLLHIDGGAASTGEVFRTNGVNGAATYWRMFRNSTEYGRIYNNNDNHFYVQANNASGDLRFNSGGTNTRMTVTSAGNVGIGTTTPGAKLEVAGQLKITGGSPGVNKILTSDAAGLASWSTAAGAGLVSGTGTTNYVPKWTPDGVTVGSSVIYDNGKIGINTTAPEAMLDVQGGAEPLGINAVGDSIGGNFSGDYFGVYTLAEGSNAIQAGLVGQSANATEHNYGVVGYATSVTDTVNNDAVLGFAQGSEVENVGVWGSAQYEPVGSPSELQNTGVLGKAGHSDFENYGGRFIVVDSVGDSYGVYASVAGTGAGEYAGYFQGNVVYTGTLTDVSDIRLKNNIGDLKDALFTLSQLQPKDYEFKTADYPYMNLPEGRQFGLIAQEVEAVVPELVSDIVNPEIRDSTGKMLSPQIIMKGVNYTSFIPLLISGIKEQQAMIDSLQLAFNSRLAELEARMNTCCGADIQFRNTDTGSGESEEVSQLTVELSSLQIVILEQNVPNPFKEQTSISYFVPDDATSAQMLFTDLRGKVIKTVDIEKGEGVITVFAQNLGSGTYSYSLIIDGKIAETKKMVRMR